MMHRRWIVIISLFIAPVPAQADFDLPILYPVRKTISFPEDASSNQLLRFSEVKRLTLEIHLVGGNMIRDSLVTFLETHFAKATKRIALGGLLRSVHVDQIRKLSNFEVMYQMDSNRFATKSHNSLFALGPVRKFIVFPTVFSRSLLASIGQLKFYIPVFNLADGLALDPSITDWIIKKENRNTRFIIPSDYPPEQIYGLLRFSPVSIELKTINNRIPDKILSIVKDVRGVNVTVVADGRLTMEDVRQWSRLERFSIKIVLRKPISYTPGLPALLNRIGPP